MITGIGSIGLLLLILAFTLVDIGRLKPESKLYNLLNLIGALSLILYSWELKAYIFLILEAFWAVISFFELVLPKKKS